MRAADFINEKINSDVLDPRFSHTQEINGYTYTAALEPDRFHKADLFVIRCYDGGKMIGQAKFYTTFGDSLVSALTTVQPEYQKSGIASTMYAYARMLGNTIEPSASQLPPGKRMWKAWKKSGEAQHLMREENITEGATDILYHYTGTSSAAKIFQDGAFKLSRTTGNPSEESYAPPGYPYFLSTSRSKTGDYHRWVGTGGVMFVLDGQWFSQRYPVKPIDYWERSWQFSPDRTREAEDRVFSKESEIPLGGVTAVHVLLKEQDESRSPLTRTILIQAKKLGIPVIAILDTNCDPDEVDFKIPGNDDAIRSIALLTRVMTDAIAAGLQVRSAQAAKIADKAAAEAAAAAEKTAEQPLADWEKDLIKEPTETTGA